MGGSQQVEDQVMNSPPTSGHDQGFNGGQNTRGRKEKLYANLTVDAELMINKDTIVS